MGDLQGLVETMKDLQLDKKSSILKTLASGVFTMRDLKQQFENILSMGPLSKVMGMLPGMSPEIINAVGSDDGSNRLKKFAVIMDSMTEQELDSDSKLFYNQPSRVYRVARGAGATVQDMNELLLQYKMVIDFSNISLQK
jgi:signal recognition particle subunit SRP54